MLKTTYTSGGGRSRRYETWTATQVFLPKLRPNKGSISRRATGGNNSNKAQKEYLAHIYADRTPQDYERVKQALRKDLRHGRRWSILVNGFVAENGDSISGLGLGLLLLCGPGVARKITSAGLTRIY
ncbi:uncharacterized protein KY384_005289 [Bacidia gigantensis]|uniref:uncharacterized protein n=1 Tax=Bacidia gigantensis TaxID=2732470 RepID=UPI001D04581F|nr:uncharacterized protein KY384_005289 [Bacidia gigantensis]KAG8529808.1 hypothetical protein KY384_005289 [Bacidia gigantensis]